MNQIIKIVLSTSIAALLACGDAAGTQWVRIGAQYVFDYIPGTGSVFPPSCGGPSVEWNGQFFFAGSIDGSGCELAAMGDLDSDPVLLANVGPGAISGQPHNVTPCGDLLYYVATAEGFQAAKLWATDGTPEGTYLVADINPTGDALIDVPACIRGFLYFSADDGIHGTEPWSSNGSAQGTHLVADVNPGGGSLPGIFTELSGEIYFTADDGVVGRELRRFSESPPYSVLVSDIWPGPDSGRPSLFVPFRGGLLFRAAIATLTSEPYFTDGTTEGTALIKVLNDVVQAPFVKGSTPDHYTVLGDVVVFSAATNAFGGEPWRSDGTAEGTYLLKDIDPRPFDLINGTSSPQNLTRFGDHVYFTARDDENHKALWYTDGTVEGTQPFPGLRTDYSAMPSGFVEIHGFLYFLAGTVLYRLNSNEELEIALDSFTLGYSDGALYHRGLLVYRVNSESTGAELGGLNINPWLTSFAPELAGPTDAQEVSFLMTFSEPVTGVDASDFEVVGPGLSGAFVSSTEAIGDGQSWRVYVDTGLGDGTVSLRLVDDDSIVDTWALRWADDPLPPPLAPLDGFGTADASTSSTGGIAIDKPAPTVLLSSPAAVIGTGSAVVTATFERAVTGFTAEDVLLSNATLSDFAGSGAEYTFTLTPGAEGDFTAVIPFGAAMDGGSLENAPSNVLTLTLNPAVLIHKADTNQDGKISLSELLRVIQFYNTPGYHCNPANVLEDRYDPGFEGDKNCEPHTSDYQPQDWLINLSEIIRAIQFYNVGNYRYCGNEQLEADGYCVDAP